MEISNEILPIFTKAGWFPNRKITLSKEILKSIPENHPAIQILQEFINLEVGECGSGESCAKSDVIFEYIELDNDEVENWSKSINTTLIGIANVHHYHCELFIDSNGRYFSLILNDVMCFEGDNFNQAMEILLLGRRSKPVLLPGQKSVYAWGIEFTKDSPEIFDYHNNRS